jgi:hypothetical protein
MFHFTIFTNGSLLRPHAIPRQVYSGQWHIYLFADAAQFLEVEKPCKTAPLIGSADRKIARAGKDQTELPFFV